MTAQARINYPTKALIKRAVDAAREAGLDVAGFEVSADGSIRIMEARALPSLGADEFARLEAQGLI